MRMNEVSLFDPLAVVEGQNPPLLAEPFRFSVQDHVGRVLYLDPRRVKPMKRQPRSDAEQARLEEMEASFRVVGQEETGLVFPIADPDFDAGLIAGHRRRLTCLRLDWMYRVEVRPAPADWKELYIKALASNCNREDLSIRDLTEAVRELLRCGCPRQEISAIIGKSTQVVDQYIALANLNPEVFPFLDESNEDQRASDGRKLRRTTLLTLGYAVEIAKLPVEDQVAAAEAVVDELMTTNDVKHFVRQRLERHGMVRTRTHSPDEHRRLLSDGLRSFELLLQSYGSMSHDELLVLRRGMDSFQRSNLDRRFRAVAADLSRLAAVLGPYDAELWHPAMRSWLRQGLMAYGESNVPLEEWLTQRGYTPRSLKLLEEWLARYGPDE